jgi:hypothetical protein
MFGSTILDVAIGVVFIFLLISLIASAIREGIETFLKSRASHLEAGLRELFHDPQGTGLVKHFFDHPIIYSLYAGKYSPDPGGQGLVAFCNRNLAFWRRQNLPSYIPSRNFALTLMDMAARGPKLDSGTSPDATSPITVDSIRANLGTIENPAVQRALLIALDRAEGDLQKAQANLEAWYDSAMDRVSGWYKRSTQWFLIGIGLLLAVVLNINVLKIAGTLYHDKAARELIVESAKSAVADKNGKPLVYADAKTELDNLGIPIGWSHGGTLILNDFRNHWPSDLGGWLLTAFAVSLGAPFWFDLLNKLIVVRSTVKPHQKSPEEPSQDRPSESTDAANPPLPVAALTQSPPLLAGAPTAAQVQADEDGCDVDMTRDITSDEDLPIAMGGVS